MILDFFKKKVTIDNSDELQTMIDYANLTEINMKDDVIIDTLIQTVTA